MVATTMLLAGASGMGEGSAKASYSKRYFLEGLALQSALAVCNAQHHERMIE